VLQFSLSQEVYGNKVGESKRIETNISNVSLELRRLFKERKGLAGDVSRRRGNWGLLGNSGLLLNEGRPASL
jgi:hypothetical protein